jgi:hypothetical protein
VRCRTIVATLFFCNLLRIKALPKKTAKSKDVRALNNPSLGSSAKNSADSLPKILALACRSGSLQRQRVRCGKINCKCTRGALHEAYYFFYWMHTRTLKVYVRRADVETVMAAIAARRRHRAALRSEMKRVRAFLRRMMLDSLGVRI